MQQVIDRLVNMSNDEFRKVVDRDLRRKRNERLSDEGQALRTPELVDRWLATLATMSRSAEGQLAARRSDFEAFKARNRDQIAAAQAAGESVVELEREFLQAKADYESSRASTIRFKTGLDETTIEARGLAAKGTVRSLTEAIRRHREEVMADNEEVSDADEELWAVAL